MGLKKEEAVDRVVDIIMAHLEKMSPRKRKTAMKRLRKWSEGCKKQRSVAMNRSTAL
jgi:hypothetical protein